MSYLQLTLKDDKEVRVQKACGSNWIFHIISTDPRSIEDFIKAEIELGETCATQHSIDVKDLKNIKMLISSTPSTQLGHHNLQDLARIGTGIYQDSVDRVLKVAEKAGLDLNDGIWQINHLPVTYPASSSEGLNRIPDNGGTVIVDLPKRLVTVKGHTEDELFEEHGKDLIKLLGKVMNKNTGEFAYISYGLISGLRQGTAGYRVNLGQASFELRVFAEEDFFIESDPANPTKENPRLLWKLDRFTGQEAIATQYKIWETQYKIPESWTIRDGIRHIDYKSLFQTGGDSECGTESQ